MDSEVAYSGPRLGVLSRYIQYIHVESRGTRESTVEAARVNNNNGSKK